MSTFNDHSVKRPGNRVAIVAAGVISPLGSGLGETSDSLRAGQDCVTRVSRFSTDQCRCTTAGQVPDGWLKPADGERSNRFHRSTKMMILALQEVLKQDKDFQPDLAVIGTTSGGMSFGENYYRALQKQKTYRRAPEWIASYAPQKPVIAALRTFGLETACQVIANACASGTNAIGHAFKCVRSGRYDRVLTGGYDAVSELVFVGFDSLQAATPEKCRPFDCKRSGMVLGEGAAVLALENLESAKHRSANILAEIIGYGISTDNHHLTQPDPSGVGPRKAMQGALTDANIKPDAVGYINAHGTATVFNDAAEGKAIAELFGNSIPVSSTKSMMGHSLGAAGAIEAVFCLLALQQSFLPPNINFNAPDENIDLDIVANSARASQFDVALSNSFGFGGTNASVLLRRFGE